MRHLPCNQPALEPAWEATLEEGKLRVLPATAGPRRAEPAAGFPAPHTPANASGHSQGGTVGDRRGEDARCLKAAITQPSGLMGLHLNYKAQSPLLWVKL